MGQLLRRLAVLSAGIAVVICFGATPAWAAPTVSVTPSTGLVHLQTVTVTGSGYTSGQSLAVLQCVGGGTDVFDACNISGFVSVTANSSGSFSTTLTVRRILEIGGVRTDCAAAPGTCVVAVSPFSSTILASTPLTFDPNGPLPVLLDVTVTDVSAVVEDNVVLLEGTVTCTTPAFVFIEGRLRQVVRRFFIDAPFEVAVECDGEQQFAVVFEGQNGVIKRGDAELDLTAFGNSPDSDDTFVLDTTIRVGSK